MSILQQNPNNVVMSFTEEGDLLGDVRIMTIEGDEYVFPNMNISQLKRVLPEGGRRPTDMPCVAMVNTSLASLTIPLRIVRRISTEDGILWDDRPRPIIS